MENNWEMLLELWNIILLSHDKNQVLIGQMLHKNMSYPLGPWPMGRSKLPACYFLFRMEFTQHLDDYEHAKCVELYGWKCYICCVEAKDQVGLEMQHIGDGVVYMDGIDGSKWLCCQKCKKTYHLECVSEHKEGEIKSPFLCTFNECRGSRR